MKVIVTNIQRFCLHDGPGIRTTVFFKGCSLKCPWCSNPENIEFNIQQYEYENKKGLYGYEISIDELEKEILKDYKFYENNGGVTFSGGDALLQFENIEPLLEKLKKQGINMCVETALVVPEKLVDIAIKYVDEFIIDIKILDKDNVKKINGNLETYLKNIDKIFKNNSNVIFRIPLVKNYTITDNNIKEILKFLGKYKPVKVEIFRIHRLGEKKYKTLGTNMPEFEEVNMEEINTIKNEIEKLDIEVEICKI